MKQTELLAPGGSFESALATLENGADAVYCGLERFSARKAAKNLSTDELSKLRKWTSDRNKKVYLTLNTILKQQELPQAVEILFLARDLSLDGIIVQDPGLIKIVRDHFPSLELHGSTQMAVHNSWGVAALKDAGFSRVVLPRELTIREIAGLHRQHPDMELEVFIHGAQCYGFSGLCLASGLMLNRSGNRGDCGQICRTWFEHSSGEGYFFSCNDLSSGWAVWKLIEAGVRSLKIEGRMKSPVYAAAVARLYRHILDRKDPEALQELEEEARIAFSRKPVKGHLLSRKGDEMVNPAYPGHLGIPAGTVKQGDAKSLVLESRVKLSARDGLMYLTGQGKPVHFSLRFSGDRKSAPPGQIRLRAPVPPPPRGTTLYKTHSHNHHWKEVKPGSFRKSLLPLETEITLSASELSVHIPVLDFHSRFPVEAEKASGSSSLRQKVEQEIGKPGECDFVLQPILFPEDGKCGEDLFLPPSRIKKIRQELYRLVEEQRKTILRRETEIILTQLENEWETLRTTTPYAPLPVRQQWEPRGTRLPYLTETDLEEQRASPGSAQDRVFVPLAPLQLPGRDESYKEILLSPAGGKTAERVYGLNNWGHIGLFRSDPFFRNAGCILDAGLLTANKAGVLLFAEMLPGIVRGCYGWVESPPEDLPEGLSPLGESSRFPLFISRNCFKKHSLRQSCKGCNGSGRFSLTQNGKTYTVLVQDCISWVFQGKSDAERARASS